MSDLQPLSEAEAAEHVFLQYRHYTRKWRRFRGKPVRSLRRHVRRFVKRRSLGKGKGGGFGSFGRGFHGGGRRSFMVTLEDLRAYFGSEGKGGKRSLFREGPWTEQEPAWQGRQQHDLPHLRQ